MRNAGHTPAICFYGPRAGRIFDGIIPGGAQLQTGLLARALLERGVRAVIVDPEAGQDRMINGVEIMPIPSWHRGIRGLRLFTHRIPGMIRALRASGASLMYARGFSFLYLLVFVAARLAGARFALSTASDADLAGFRARYQTIYKGKWGAWDWVSTIIPNEIAQKLLLRSVDVLLVQHEGQAAMASFRRKPVLICRNIVGTDLFHIPRRDDGRSVVIVGTLSVYKGLDALLEVIDAVRDVTFEFIGKATDAEGRRAEAELRKRSNVVLHGPLAREETLRRIAAAKALVNTSPQEGFPNTFLEAWAIGTPVISLWVDPGGVISRHRLGYACQGDIERFTSLLRCASYEIDTDQIKQYVRRNHTGASATDVLLSLLPRQSDVVPREARSERLSSHSE